MHAIVEGAEAVPTRSKPGYLFVICSGNQLYSGTGTAIFEWIRYAKDHFRFGLLMDCTERRNFDIGKKFCADNGVKFIPEVPAPKLGACDPGVARIAHYLRSGDWPYVEIVSWANAATNIDVVTSVPNETKLIFTPHNQPKWTIADSERHFLIEPVLQLCLKRADVVACDCPAEVATLRDKVPEARALDLPIGVDDKKFRLSHSPKERQQVLLICDFFEHRKRPDLAIAAMQRVMARHNVSFVMAGRGSDSISLPASIESRTTRLGYVNEADLLSLYQRSSVFLLLSDYEAFGIPIVEALFCGTRVVINDTREMHSLYADLPGVRLVNNRDDAAVDSAILAALEENDRSALIRDAAVVKFAVENAFGRKLAAIKESHAHMPQSESRLYVADVVL
ncbi:MAG: glycosyltransferase [Methylovirgula sp.]